MKTLIALCTILITTNLPSQTTKGNWLTGGQLAYLNFKNSVENLNQLTPLTELSKGNNKVIRLQIGYCIKDHLAIGIAPAFGHSNFILESRHSFTNELIAEGKGTGNSKDLSIFLRKYIPINNQFSLFAQFQTGMGDSKSKASYSEIGMQKSFLYETSNAIHAGVGFGAIWFPSKKVGIHAGLGDLGWISESVKGRFEPEIENDYNERTSIINFNLGSAVIELGFTYFFNL